MDQEAQQAGTEPCRMFVEMLRAAITSGKAYLADTDGCEPAQPKRWGWREELAGDKRVMRPGGDLIGWIDGQDAYLEPRASYAAAKKMARDMGENIPVTARTLHKRLKDRNMLSVWSDQRREITVRRVIQGDRKRVLALWSDLLSPSGKSAHCGKSVQEPETGLAESDNPPTNPPTESSVEPGAYTRMGGLSEFSPPYAGESQRPAIVGGSSHESAHGIRPRTAHEEEIAL